MDSSALNQGDVIRDVELLGAFDYRGILQTMDSHGRVVGWSTGALLAKSAVIVLSHSCELVPEHGGKLTSIILAPISDARSTPPDRLPEVIRSNLIDFDNPKPSYLKYFYLEPHAELGLPAGGLVEFSKLFSVHKATYKRLLGSKVLQLRQDIADLMAYKLGLYFFRREEE